MNLFKILNTRPPNAAAAELAERRERARDLQEWRVRRKIAEMGEKYLCHPSNKVKRSSK